ncbi:hypothetical protein ACWER9_06685 [Micromonospora sp. NPDC003944]
MSRGAHAMAERTARALDIVEQIAGRTGDPATAQLKAIDLMLDPVAPATIPVMLALLSEACKDLAEASGRPVAEVVAGWRASSARYIDMAERARGDLP